MTQVRVADGAGQSLRFLEVRGFMYPDFPIESIRGVPQLAIHADDVIICAYPKSGKFCPTNAQHTQRAGWEKIVNTLTHTHTHAHNIQAYILKIRLLIIRV